MSDQTEGFAPQSPQQNPTQNVPPGRSDNTTPVNPANPATAPDKSDEDFSHYVHLADGRVIKHQMDEPLGSHYVENEDDENKDTTRTQIIGVYPK